MNDEQLAEKYLTQRRVRKAKGFAIDTQGMNPEEYEEILFEGEDLFKALEGYVRKIDEYWICKDNEEQVWEDIWEAVEWVEENSDVSFEDFKRAENENQDNN